ncbi:MAG: AI-2E family transporter [Polyangiaceae bacterium]
MNRAEMTHARKRLLLLVASAAVAAAVCWLARPVLLPIVLGAVVAYVVLPLVRFFQTKGLSRPVAIILTYVLILGSLGIFVRVTARRLSAEVGSFAREMPALVERARERWIPNVERRIRAMRGDNRKPIDASDEEKDDKEEAFVVHQRPDGSFGVEVEDGVHVRRTRDGFVLTTKAPPERQPFDADKFLADSLESSLEYARSNAIELARIGGGLIAAAARFVFIFGLTLMVGAYLILTREKIGAFFSSLARPKNRPDLAALAARIDRGLAGVVRGQLVICLINGALSAVGFAIVGVKYWPLLAIVATVFSLVPIFGSIASAVPAVALALTQGVGTAAFVLIWILAIHQLEANFLNPKIMGDSAKIHPVLVIFALLVGEHFFGVVGALLAVPCMSIAQSLFLHLLAIYERNDPDFAPEIAEGPTAR